MSATSALVPVHPSSDDALILCTASDWNGEPTFCRWCNKPLEGKRRRWCSDECGNQFGWNHWWSSASWAARKRDGQKCVRCGTPDIEAALEVHHKTPILGRHNESGCHHHLDGLETLCRACHLVEHHGKREPVPEQLRIEAA